MSTKFPLAAICFWLFSCSGTVPSATLDAWCEDHQCAPLPLAFAVQSGHEAPLESALRNLNNASGLDLIEDPEGIPVYFEPEVFNPDTGERDCGNTIITRDASTGDVVSIEIHIASEMVWSYTDDGLVEPWCLPQWSVLRHEIACHALAPNAGEHEADGVCSPWSQGGTPIDQRALNRMCQGVGGCPAVSGT